jgi:hypothetical protein
MFAEGKDRAVAQAPVEETAKLEKTRQHDPDGI